MISMIVTLGYGSFGTVNYIPTLGYGDYGGGGAVADSNDITLAIIMRCMGYLQ